MYLKKEVKLELNLNFHDCLLKPWGFHEAQQVVPGRTSRPPAHGAFQDSPGAPISPKAAAPGPFPVVVPTSRSMTLTKAT